MMPSVGYGPISAVCIVVLCALLVCGIVPLWIKSSMVKKHRVRRDDASVHMVKIEAAPMARGTKGADMSQKSDAEPVARLTRAQIEHVRALRKESIRRRRVLVLSLLVIAAIVAVLGVICGFSVYYCLIPVALDIVVLAFGIRTAKSARRWEKIVATSRLSGKPVMSSRPLTKPLAAQDKNHEDNAPTFIIPVQDVEKIVEQQKHSAVRPESVTPRAKAAAKKTTAKSVGTGFVNFSLGSDDSARKIAAKRQASVPKSEWAKARRPVGASDLGDRNAIQSAEIKSYRQVATATPVSADSQRAIFADVTPSGVSLKKVSAPSGSSSSLGADLDSVLSRRSR